MTDAPVEPTQWAIDAADRAYAQLVELAAGPFVEGKIPLMIIPRGRLMYVLRHELAQARTAAIEEFNKLAALMDEADAALDKDTYDQKRLDDFDAPDDAEWLIRAGTERKIIKTFAEIDRIRRALARPTGSGK